MADRLASSARPAICRQGGLLPPYCGLPRGHDGPHRIAHRYDCDCGPCVELRTNLAAIAEADREAWRNSRDIVL